MTWNVGIYARLSRDDERAGESLSIENQKASLTNYISEQGWNLVNSYCDDGYAGTNFNRSELTRLLADVKGKRINLVIVKDLSLLGRDHTLVGRGHDTQ